MGIVATQNTKEPTALQKRKSSINVAKSTTLAASVKVNPPLLAEAVIEVTPDQEGVVMNNQMKLVYALDGYQRNLEDAHSRGQHTCLRSDAAELLPDV